MPAAPRVIVRRRDAACLASVRGPFFGVGEIVDFALFFLAFRA